MTAASVRLRVYLVDGGMIPLSKRWAFVEQVRALQARGVEDWQIIHELVGDDWGPPPSYVEIAGQAPDGGDLSMKLRYNRPRR